MSKHASPAASISPKVNWALLGGLGLTVLCTALAGLTPDMFDFLGEFAVPVTGGLVAGGAWLAGYLKRDPLREVGSAAVVVGETPTGLPHPDSVPDATTAEADALAARAAEIRRGGVS